MAYDRHVTNCAASFLLPVNARAVQADSHVTNGKAWGCVEKRIGEGFLQGIQAGPVRVAPTNGVVMRGAFWGGTQAIIQSGRGEGAGTAAAATLPLQPDGAHYVRTPQQLIGRRL